MVNFHNFNIYSLLCNMNKRLPLIQTTYMSFIVLYVRLISQKCKQKNPDEKCTILQLNRHNHGVGDTQENLDTRCIRTVGRGYKYMTSIQSIHPQGSKPLIRTSSVDAIVHFNMFGHMLFDFELSK